MTVLSKERIEVSAELKRCKYAVLQVEGRRNELVVTVWAVEVGCRGFPASSMASLLRAIRIDGGERQRRFRRIGEVAEKASKPIWHWSRVREWGQKK